MNPPRASFSIRTHVVGIEQVEKNRYVVTVDGHRFASFCSESRRERRAGSRRGGWTSSRMRPRGRAGSAASAKPPKQPALGPFSEGSPHLMRLLDVPVIIRTGQTKTVASSRSSPLPHPAGLRERLRWMRRRPHHWFTISTRTCTGSCADCVASTTGPRSTHEASRAKRACGSSARGWHQATLAVTPTLCRVAAAKHAKHRRTAAA